MQLGIFSKTYEGTLEHVFQKMEQDQLTCTQFNLSSAGMEVCRLPMIAQC